MAEHSQRTTVGIRVWNVGVRLWCFPFCRAAAVAALFGWLAYRYCAVYFPLDAGKVGGPGDFQANSALGWIVAKTLSEHGELPLWNPYVHSGLPLIGEPYLSFFNPFVVLPLLTFGPVDGPKVVATCAVALSGLGQYWLSRVLGHGRVISLVAGVLGMTAGSLVGRLASGMSFEQGMQHAWMAATLASFIVVLRTRRPIAVAVAALCYALMFHAGNLYYWIVLTAVLIIFTAGYAIAAPRTRTGPPVRLRWGTVAAAVGVAVLTFLLIGAQALPMVDLSGRVEKPIDVDIRGTQPPLATLFNFVVPDRQYWARQLLGASDLGWSVHYAYVGGSVLLFFLFLVPAFLRRPTRDLPLLLLATTLTVALASAKHTFVLDLWRTWDLIRQFRFWGEIVAVTTVLLIPLAMAGADYLWQRLVAARDTLDRWGPQVIWQPPPAPQAVDTQRPEDAAEVLVQRSGWSMGLVRPLLWAMLLLALWNAMADPWSVNSRVWYAPDYPTGSDELLGWLRQHDPNAFTLDNNDNVIAGYANVPHIKYGMQVLNSSWVLKARLIKSPGAPEDGLLKPAPKYILTHRDAAAPPGAT
ncbi:MAG: hypothetical protein ACRDI2_15415, partial [Chloroflexota bacterium]